ncbi:MAG: hypothetical protein VX669_05905, partial [Planctomycetota bacterium]|nr:hypothetical protein [Planctomycetota bacterium]
VWSREPAVMDHPDQPGGDRPAGWLEETRRELVDLPVHPFDDPAVVLPAWKQPGLWAIVALLVLSYFVFVVLW